MPALSGPELPAAYKIQGNLFPSPAANVLRLSDLLGRTAGLREQQQQQQRVATGNTGAWSSPASTEQLEMIVACLRAAPGQADPAQTRRVHLSPDDTATPSSFVEALIKAGETISPDDENNDALDGPTGELPQIHPPAEEDMLPPQERASGRHACEGFHLRLSKGARAAGIVLVAAGVFAGANHLTNGRLMDGIEQKTTYFMEKINGGPLPK